MLEQMKTKQTQLQVRPNVETLRRFIRVKSEHQRRTLSTLTDTAWHEQLLIAGIEHFENEFDLLPIEDSNKTLHPHS